jgi:ArsR family transcriptional regulator, arsenate/arsenite/antimonite-responsive transcriptional repressor
MKQIKILKALADENRVRILNLLCKKDMCVCEIEYILGISQSNASGHLAKLSEAEIIFPERQGHYVIYRINPSIFNEFSFIKEFLEQELGKIPILRDDLMQLDESIRKNTLNRQDLLSIKEETYKTG